MTFGGNDGLMAALAVKNNLDTDRVMACYLVAGDDLFWLMRILEGQTVTVPSKRRLGCANLHNVRFLEDDERKYSELVRRDEVEEDGKAWTVVGKERKILNHWYLPVTEEEDEEDEQQ